MQEQTIQAGRARIPIVETSVKQSGENRTRKTRARNIVNEGLIIARSGWQLPMAPRRRPSAAKAKAAPKPAALPKRRSRPLKSGDRPKASAKGGRDRARATITPEWIAIDEFWWGSSST